MDKRLSIVIIEPDPDRAEPIMAGLRDAGDYDIRIIAGETGLARRIAELRPDVVLIDLANPSRDILEAIARGDRREAQLGEMDRILLGAEQGHARHHLRQV